VLPDLAYHGVIAKLHIGSWDEFVGDRTFEQVVDEIYGGLANHKDKPSWKAIEYLCTFNEICRLRNVAARTATKRDIALAYHDWQDDEERGFVAELYSFHYGEDILSVSLDYLLFISRMHIASVTDPHAKLAPIMLFKLL